MQKDFNMFNSLMLNSVNRESQIFCLRQKRFFKIETER